MKKSVVLLVIIATLLMGCSAPAPAQPAPTTVSFSGTNNTSTNRFALRQGAATFQVEYTGKRNFVVWLLDGNGSKLDVVANEVNEFKGSKVLNIKAPGPYLLDVSADGPWKVTVQQGN